MEFGTSEWISLAAFAVSLWTAFERWRDKQPAIFASDINVHFFDDLNLQVSHVRLDLTLTNLSERPVPISRPRISMGKGKSCDCTYRSPIRRSPGNCIELWRNAEQKLDDIFGPCTRLPMTLSPSSAQHIVLWTTLQSQSELLHSLRVSACSEICPRQESSIERKFRTALSCHNQRYEPLAIQSHCIEILFHSGERTLIASSLISSDNQASLLD